MGSLKIRNKRVKVFLFGFTLFMAPVAIAIYNLSQVRHYQETSFNLAAKAIPPRVKLLGSDTHDFGLIDKDTTVEYAFKLANIGNEKLRILDGRADCDCLAPVWTNLPVAAGDTAEVGGIYYSHGQIGKFRKVLVFHTNGIPSEITLVLTGEVMTDSSTQPQRLTAIY